MSDAEATPAAATPGKERTALEAAERNADNIPGKIFLITGAYSGIGVETAKALLTKGGKVIVGGRNPKLQDEFVEELQEDYGADAVDGHVLDLGDLASVKTFCKYVLDKYPTVDCAILNAGIMNTPPGLTKDGFEQQFGVNVIGHFLVAKLLAPITKRQVWVSSSAHRYNNSPRVDLEKLQNFSLDDTKDYDFRAAYQQSKLGNILLAKEFTRRYQPNLVAASCHPGVISTNLARHMGLWEKLVLLANVVPRMLFDNPGAELTIKTPSVGASTSVTVATMTDLTPGGYYSNCEIMQESESAQNMDDAKALFDYCDQVTSAFQ